MGDIRAFVLVDMIGDRDLDIAREGESTTWLTDLIWTSARRLGHERHFLDDVEPIGGDDHFPFLEAGVPAVDIIDFHYPAWHTAADTLDKVSARSLQIVGDVLLDALPAIERRLARVAPRKDARSPRGRGFRRALTQALPARPSAATPAPAHVAARLAAILPGIMTSSIVTAGPWLRWCCCWRNT